ncbi:MAG: DUF2004 domain-containing protein [Comamonas sp.]|uniref:DUF2004 domain-containing protein n=1 Tax=unclassified Comamonas TaxID=2638500 RepID=UPI000EB1D571|nr:DUF2004 domain-containing protein [Comamonas sp. lk]
MAQINHTYFGPLNTDKLQDTDVVWEAHLPLAGREVEAWLWAAPQQELNSMLLGAFATTLNNLPTLDARARAALLTYLQEDSDFIAFHVDLAQEENAQGLEATQILIAHAQSAGQTSVDALDFVGLLTLHSMGLWCSSEGAPLVLDYRIDPEGSDQILAVKCDATGRITDISWES